MPSFCIIINENTRESAMWVGKNREDGKWFVGAPEDFDGTKEFARVLQTCPDPEALTKRTKIILKKVLTQTKKTYTIRTVNNNKINK